jgi:XTP/dITP diphosphohydrolase
MRLIIASNNAKKRREIAAILDILGIEILPPESTRFVDVEEDGDTFADNARKKAEAFANANSLPALADDSGLAVDALGGEPGVYSARYAGDDATDATNNAKLLAEMKGIDNRHARFVCALYLSYPDGRAPVTAEGMVEGYILEQPDGTSGFGYDPLFFCPELGKSFGHATPEEKASVSHRGRALHQLAEKLRTEVGE